MIGDYRITCLSLILALTCWTPGKLDAHCDGMDGPVVKAAQQALVAGNVNAVLIWVQKKDESEVKRAFEKTISVRKLSPEAAALADNYFFETLVRLHRAGEGEPYSGLKPAGRDLGPAIPAADKALESGSVEPLLQWLGESVKEGMRQHYREAMARKGFRQDDIDGGRGYVKAYVEYVHLVERIYEAASNSSHNPSNDGRPGAVHE
jgi:hypothetical protein